MEQKRKFQKIKNLLIEKFGKDIEYSQDENGTEYLNIKNSNLWVSNTFQELVVGFGFNHTHFSEEYENLNEGIIQVFELLTNRIKTTDYIKGKTIFKTTVEIEFPHSELKNIGESSVLLYPFWKKTKIETEYFEKLMDKTEIEKEANIILNTD